MKKKHNKWLVGKAGIFFNKRQLETIASGISSYLHKHWTSWIIRPNRVMQTKTCCIQCKNQFSFDNCFIFPDQEQWFCPFITSNCYLSRMSGIQTSITEFIHLCLLYWVMGERLEGDHLVKFCKLWQIIANSFEGAVSSSGSTVHVVRAAEPVGLRAAASRAWGLIRTTLTVIKLHFQTIG